MSGEAGKRPAVTGHWTRRARFAFNRGLSSSSRCHPILREFADSLFAVVFPTRCLICNREVASANGLGVCADCWLGVEPWEGISCERCGLPIVSERAADSSEVLCGVCRVNEPAFDRARGYGIYRGALRHLILELKFRRRERLGRRLGGFLAHAWKTLGGPGNGEPYLIVPVPLFRSRERERGFNQARLLAEGLKKQLGRKRCGTAAKIETGLLIRTRATRPQTRLKLQQRMENVRGAFSVSKPTQILDRQIVLVDDVMTTGATLSACAGALKKSGAAKVYALTLARATPQFPDTDDLPGSAGVDEFGSQ